MERKRWSALGGMPTPAYLSNAACSAWVCVCVVSSLMVNVVGCSHLVLELVIGALHWTYVLGRCIRRAQWNAFIGKP